MRADSRLIRNLAFMGMLGAAWSGGSRVAAGPEDCGPYTCTTLCPSYGGTGYIETMSCDADSCDGSGCTGGGDNCLWFCTWCNDGRNWVCS